MFSGNPNCKTQTGVCAGSFLETCKNGHRKLFFHKQLDFILWGKLCTFGSFITMVHERGSALESFTRIVNGNLFSLNARTTNLSCSPDLVTGTRFPANSIYTGLPSRTCVKIKIKKLKSVRYRRALSILCYKTISGIIMYVRPR